MNTQVKRKPKLTIKASGEKIIKEGYKYLSTPYRWGAKPFQTSEFDCSSFVQFLYGRFRIVFPRTSREQCLLGEKIEKDQLKRGDLLFFTNRMRCKKKGIEKVAHIAIFLGDNKMLHSCRDKGVTVSKFSEIINEAKQKRWSDYYLFARRIPNYMESLIGDNTSSVKKDNQVSVSTNARATTGKRKKQKAV